MTETFLARVARAVSEKPADEVFARWFDSKGDEEDVRTFQGIWKASGEVRLLCSPENYEEVRRFCLLFTINKKITPCVQSDECATTMVCTSFHVEDVHYL